MARSKCMEAMSISLSFAIKQLLPGVRDELKYIGMEIQFQKYRKKTGDGGCAMEEIYDLIIVGGGPAGVAAAIYASRAMLKTLWLNSSFSIGGQITESSLVDNYPGLPGVSGASLGEAFEEHAEKLGILPEREKVRSVDKNPETGLFTVESKKHSYLGRGVIYAAGAAHRELNLPGEKEYAGMGVSYCATCDGAFFKNQRAAVIGGGNTAVTDAVFLARICEKVYLVHRRDELRADRLLQKRLFDTENIEVLWNQCPFEIRGGEAVTEMVLKHAVTGEKSNLPVNAVFIAVGMVPNTEPLQPLFARNLLKTDAAGYIEAKEDCRTSLSGFYAAGDIRTKALRQVVTAAGDGANAVHSVVEDLISVLQALPAR